MPKRFEMNGFGSPAGGQAPAQWTEHFTPDGRAYYYNPGTKVTQWTKPEELMGAAEVCYTLDAYWVVAFG